MIIPIKVTEKALEEIKRIRAQKSISEDYALRIFVQSSAGCGSADVLRKMGFDMKKESDQEFTIQGVRFFYEKKHLMYLLGYEIDYEMRPTESGFVFNKKV